MQPAICAMLKAAGIDHYDFRNPAGNTGFHWSEVMPSYEKGSNGVVEFKEYKQALSHQRSQEGFRSDWDAMHRATHFILLLPCGRSAHLEAGWAVGAGKLVSIYLDDPCTPELMYLMADLITDNIMDLLFWLGVED
jgi:hypothetical protein